MTEAVSNSDESRKRKGSVLRRAFKIVGAGLKLLFSFCLFSILGVGLGRFIFGRLGVGEAAMASVGDWGWIVGGGAGLIVPWMASGGSLAIRKTKSAGQCETVGRQSEQPRGKPSDGGIASAAGEMAPSIQNPDATGASAKTVLGHALVLSFAVLGIVGSRRFYRNEFFQKEAESTERTHGQKHDGAGEEPDHNQSDQGEK